MKIAFICSGLEPGRDGVGDYTRCLAGELIREDHKSVIISLNDAVDEIVNAVQSDGQIDVPALRLPRSLPWDRRIAEASKFVGNADWLSLQFVPFGFHEKGLCFGLGKRLAAISPGAKKQIMFHELWLGLEENVSVKYKLWGAIQKRNILDMVRRLSPNVVHTHARPYRHILAVENIEALPLPLFCNVPFSPGDGWNDVIAPLVGVDGARREDLYIAGVFGAVHSQWNARDSVDAIKTKLNGSHERLVILFFGRSNLPDSYFGGLKTSLNDETVVVNAGERTAAEVSQIIQSLDVGLATTPRQAIEKSSSVATLIHHGVPILATRNDWRIAGMDEAENESEHRVYGTVDFAELPHLPRRLPAGNVDTSLKQTAAAFISSLEKAQTA